MATLQTTQINRLNGENIINPFMLFGNAFVWNVVSGSGTGSNISWSNSPTGRAFRINATGGDTLTTVNSGSTETQQTIGQEGNYIISFDALTSWQEGTNAPASIKVTMFVNGIANDMNFSTPATEDLHDIWQTYYATIFLEVGDVISWQFAVQTFDLGISCRILFSRFKLELSEGGFLYPSPFNLPYLGQLQLVPPTTTGKYRLSMTGAVGSWELIREATATLDFPSTLSGGEADLTIALSGAVVGRNVEVIPPTALQGVYRAFCDTVDVITVRFINTTGATYDPASGSFKVIQ